MAECLGQFYVRMQDYLSPPPPPVTPVLAPQLFMQISCPILAIVQHKVTIANK